MVCSKIFQVWFWSFNFLNFRLMIEVCWQLVSPTTTVWQFIFWKPFTNMFEYLILVGIWDPTEHPFEVQKREVCTDGCSPIHSCCRWKSTSNKNKYIYIGWLCVYNILYTVNISCLHSIPFFWTGYSCKLRQVEIFKGSFVVLGFIPKSRSMVYCIDICLWEDYSTTHENEVRFRTQPFRDWASSANLNLHGK